MILLVQKLMKQLRSEAIRGSWCLSIAWFLIFSFFLFQFPPLLFTSFFASLSLHPPSLQPLQLPAVLMVFLLFLFLSPSLSQPGLFRYLKFFICKFFLLFCLSACHCLCLPQPPPMGEFLSLLCLNQSLPMETFFFLSS